ncbi:hypothetical protein SKTS_13340 [Sulfurimicrobium lacus]|uniref:Uncharacterized protein n=1 Tax=Sulfurimicrobium lacus TaxID=2715678 RepID=A0A6F8V9R7_9PROT|nr:hypothetical protein [Sulfurimicrobium lacus]BCB26448.1 hypothetical protein SKTS_13340 [Sulfurimicrobium lacus]
MKRVDPFTQDLFTQPRAGSLACGIEIAATMVEAIDRARERGITREMIAASMGYHLGETMSENMLNAYTAQSRDKHEINLRRAMAFDAALQEDVLLNLYAQKRGGRRVITDEEAAYIELGRIHQEEKDLAERKRALQLMLKVKGQRT